MERDDWGYLLIVSAPLVLFLFLSGCSTATVTACPPLRSYSQTFSDQLASEIEAAPAGAAFPVAVEDYVSLRDQLRAACE